MADDPQTPAYRIYLLTVWQEYSQVATADYGWRFHLTDPQTGKRYGFASADAIVAALQQITSSPPPADEVYKQE